MAAEHPKAIGKYTVTRPLGKGAMGMVYEGFDPVIERKVAIKTILADFIEADELGEALSRFKREAQAGGRLQHPGIVGVYEYGNDGEMAFIVMEYVEGDELKRILNAGHRYELIEVFEIMKQLLGALDYSHKQGVVHRDIKPANLMILPGPKVKVMDFGIARLETSSLTQVGTVVGTPTHMSPEQLMGLPADGRADLWSAGVILYEMLTGVSPFLAETPAAVMHKVLQADPERPSVLASGLPPGFDAVCARALAKKADERFQTAREFQAGMLAALQGKSLSTPTAPTRTRMQAAAVDATRVDNPVATAARRAPALALPDEAIADIERSLSRHIGPLAKVLVRKSRGEAPTLEEFFRVLAENIPDDAEQSAFMKKVSAYRKAGAATEATGRTDKAAKPAAEAPANGFTPETLATAERRLASYVGPLARLLIKDAASQTGNVKELYKQLATHIDSEDERREFLASLGR
jgi:eukaryotic-like serine/threonine-protein kinase